MILELLRTHKDNTPTATKIRMKLKQSLSLYLNSQDLCLGLVEVPSSIPRGCILEIGNGGSFLLNQLGPQPQVNGNTITHPWGVILNFSPSVIDLYNNEAHQDQPPQNSVPRAGEAPVGTKIEYKGPPINL